MKFDDIVELPDEELFNYIKKFDRLTVKQLKTIAEQRGFFSDFHSRTLKSEIRDSICHDLSSNIIDKALNSGVESTHYYRLHSLDTSTYEEMLSFVEKYDKYLTEYEIKILIQKITGRKERTYRDYLSETCTRHLIFEIRKEKFEKNTVN